MLRLQKRAAVVPNNGFNFPRMVDTDGKGGQGGLGPHFGRIGNSGRGGDAAQVGGVHSVGASVQLHDEQRREEMVGNIGTMPKFHFCSSQQ